MTDTAYQRYRRDSRTLHRLAEAIRGAQSGWLRVVTFRLPDGRELRIEAHGDWEEGSGAIVTVKLLGG